MHACLAWYYVPVQFVGVGHMLRRCTWCHALLRTFGDKLRFSGENVSLSSVVAAAVGACLPCCCGALHLVAPRDSFNSILVDSVALVVIP